MPRVLCSWEVLPFCTSFRSKNGDYTSARYFGGAFMRKLLVAICSVVLAFGLAGCIGKGKAPVGKGKAPVVQTKG